MVCCASIDLNAFAANTFPKCATGQLPATPVVVAVVQRVNKHEACDLLVTEQATGALTTTALYI
jgi:hypothetical protein